MAFQLSALLRPHIQHIKPYSSARDEYTGEHGIFLDANENPYGTPGIHQLATAFHRYPDPHQRLLKNRLAELKGIEPASIFLGNGSDEAIDLLLRAFCNPGVDHIIINAPTYGMYEVAAAINQVGIREVMLTADFQLDVDRLAQAVDEHSKIVFFCSPNNPTGNLMEADAIVRFARSFQGVVVVDEAYIDFAQVNSFTALLQELPNLVVLQTLSKAWGLAALRLGMAFASHEMIAVLNKIKPPYNISGLTQQKVLEVLQHPDRKDSMVAQLLQERTQLSAALSALAVVEKVYPSDANFLLLKVKQAQAVFQYLIRKQLIVRDRSQVALCAGCLRVTVGTAEENRQLLQGLMDWQAANW